jgi:hypothetical protein
MNSHQTRYTAALSNLEACLTVARATYPAEPTEAHLFSVLTHLGDEGVDEVWMAHFEATEVIDNAAGVYAARAELTAAEDAMRWHDTRVKVLDILSRAA